MSTHTSIAIGSDHAGFEYKRRIIELLRSQGHDVRDLGPADASSTDYPDWGHAVAQAVSTGEATMGILICGTGIGMSIVANKHTGVRAAVCESVTAARLSRQHNDANVLCIGERLTGWEQALDIVSTFLSTKFDGGERHVRRVRKLER
ncbi:MAG: ribose 5-phosphate isomerase B [Bacteroidetes bacterium]|jgi:ribose 5-phosphate isomerase B|nr:ribose 5-phosphate isomerase B [Bacteroidota bacterium]